MSWTSRSGVDLKSLFDQASISHPSASSITSPKSYEKIRDSRVLDKSSGKSAVYDKIVEAKRAKWVADSTGAMLPVDFPGISPISILSGVAVAGAVKIIGDALADTAKPVYEKILDTKKDTVPVAPTPSTTVLPSVPLPSTVKTSLSPTPSVFDDTNSPSLMLGGMQSAEMISASIGSLCQILSDNHKEHMAVLGSQIQNDFDSSKELNSNINALNVILASLTQIVYESPKLAEALQPLADAVTNIPPANVNISNPAPDNSVLAEALAPVSQWAVLAKNREEFLQTPMSRHDSEGFALSSLSPMELKADKDAQIHKHMDDQNTYKVDGDEFNPLTTLLGLIPFVGRDNTFNIDAPPSEILPSHIKYL